MERQRSTVPASDISISIHSPTTEAAKVSAEMVKKKEPLYIIGRDVSHHSPAVLFCLGCVGVMLFYCLYGYVLEAIFRTEGVRPHGAYITFIQFLFYSLFALIEQLLMGGTVCKRIPLKTYALIAFLTVTTMVCSNSALGYLSYPTQVMLKCCKLIPTMIGGVLIQGKRYNMYDVFAMFSMIIGCAWFTLADSSVQPNFNLLGVILMCFALCADGAIGNVQERTMKAHGHTASEVILYTFPIGSVYIALGLIFTNNMMAGVHFSRLHLLRIYGYTFVLSLTGYLGMQFVLLLVRSYGALPAVTVTTCRKVVTIIMSFLLFTKPFTVQYIWGGLLVLGGIYLNLYSKNKDKWDSAMRDYYKQFLFKLKGRRVLSLQSFNKENII